MTESLVSIAPPSSSGAASDAEFFLTLMAMASHDLRQPLQRMTASHDALAAMPGTERHRRELAQARTATEQLAQMLDQLVDALQMHEHLRGELRVPVSLWVLFESLEREFDIRAQMKGITLRIERSHDVVVSHPAILTSMLRNLVHNAISYTPSGGWVSVESCRYGSDIRITIDDTGRGIRPSTLSTIFDAFRRGDETRSDGLGLGLFIVKHAAGLLRHRIDVRSTDGHGSRFTIVTHAFSSRDEQKNTDEPQKLHHVVLPNARETRPQLQT